MTPVLGLQVAGWETHTAASDRMKILERLDKLVNDDSFQKVKYGAF